MPIAESSVKLRAEFKTYSGSLADPTNVELRIYDHNRKLLETIPLTTENWVSVGVYEYEYTLPDYPSIYYEFTGILEGSRTVGRGEIKIKWV